MLWFDLYLKKLILIPQFYPILDPFTFVFLFKVLVQSSLEDNDSFNKFQYRFRSRHSTGSALLKVHNESALSVDAKRPSAAGPHSDL